MRELDIALRTCCCRSQLEQLLQRGLLHVTPSNQPDHLMRAYVLADASVELRARRALGTSERKFED